MARIRSIKPEFSQSESMGNVSRDARLTFILLWTLADDEGRLRGSARMLAGVLFPYDEDAHVGMPGWLAELERQGCIRRYRHAGSQYLVICNWQKHQKIDKPTPSRLPQLVEGEESTPDLFANPREDSPLDLGEDLGRDQGEEGMVYPVTAGPAAPPVAACGAATASLSASAAAKHAPKKLSTLQAACHATWEAYLAAYTARYGAAPVRNARINSQIQQFVQRLGRDAAPAVAAFFVQHNGISYARGAHTVGMMLIDAEKLHTEWATGKALPQAICVWQPHTREGARTLAATTRLADLVNDDGSLKTPSGDRNGNPAHAARFLD